MTEKLILVIQSLPTTHMEVHCEQPATNTIVVTLTHEPHTQNSDFFTKEAIHVTCVLAASPVNVTILV